MDRQYSQADRDRFATERRNQLEHLQSQIAGKVTDLVNGAEWQQWLSVAAKFHQYAFSNTMLIMLQRPEATLVAGYKTWQTSFGRQVNKGETGIRILAPVTKRIEKHTPDGAPVLDNDGNPVKVTALVGLKPVSVFDITQTSGPDLPTPATPKLLTGEAPDGLWDRLQAFVEAQGYTVDRGDCRGANGYTDPPRHAGTCPRRRRRRASRQDPRPRSRARPAPHRRQGSRRRTMPRVPGSRG